jgi:uncharacterized OB-fold protein
MSDLPPTAYTLEYPYTRSTGPVVGPFLTALRDGRILGIRCRGRVLCPPLEFDPETGETLAPDFVPVGPGGRVQVWTWIAEPARTHPFAEPFAFALILLDGADTALVHAVRAGSQGEMSTGMRVRAQWREERRQSITDVYFVPEARAIEQRITPGRGPVEMTEQLISLSYSEPLYPHRARYAKGLLEGRFIGQKSPVSGKVYIPSKGYDMLERVRMSEADDVEVASTGTVVSYTVITPVQYYGQKETEPYIRASILLDGADQPLGQQDIHDIPISEFRAGMRVRAVFRPPGERALGDLDNRWGGTGSAIERWEPTGEPDLPFEKIAGHNW